MLQATLKAGRGSRERGGHLGQPARPALSAWSVYLDNLLTEAVQGTEGRGRSC